MKKKDYLPYLVRLNKVPKGSLFMFEDDLKCHHVGFSPVLFKRGDFIIALNKFEVETLDGAHHSFQKSDKLVAFNFNKIEL